MTVEVLWGGPPIQVNTVYVTFLYFFTFTTDCPGDASPSFYRYKVPNLAPRHLPLAAVNSKSGYKIFRAILHRAASVNTSFVLNFVLLHELCFVFKIYFPFFQLFPIIKSFIAFEYFERALKGETSTSLENEVFLNTDRK